MLQGLNHSMGLIARDACGGKGIETPHRTTAAHSLATRETREIATKETRIEETLATHLRKNQRHFRSIRHDMAPRPHPSLRQKLRVKTLKRCAIVSTQAHNLFEVAISAGARAGTDTPATTRAPNTSTKRLITITQTENAGHYVDADLIKVT